MANKHPNSEITPANTDDALEGPQRIREIKKAYNERLARDHFIGEITSPDVIAQGADSADSGYHRRITIREETSAQGGPADTRLNASSTGINDSTTNKMAEIWVEKHSGTADQTSMLFLGTEGTGNQRTVVTTTQTQTLTNKTLTTATLTNPTISGGSGSLDGVAIGQTTEAAGKFTTLESTGNTTIGNSDTADLLVVKAITSGLSSDASGFTGANKMYAGIVGEIRMFAGASLPPGWLWCNGAEYTKTSKAELYAAIADLYNATGNSESSSTYGNYISNSSYFRVPDLRGRATVGTGQGYDTSDSSVTGVDIGGDESTDATTRLTDRTLGQYGGGEDHTLTAGESGASPHYHKVPVNDPGHIHVLETVQSWGTSVDYRPEWGPGPTLIDVNTASNTTGLINKTDDTLTTTEETEVQAIARESTDPATADEFHKGKSSLSRGVPAASAHTQMQPWLAINYIIKY